MLNFHISTAPGCGQRWKSVDKTAPREFSSYAKGFPQVFHTGMWMEKTSNHRQNRVFLHILTGPITITGSILELLNSLVSKTADRRPTVLKGSWHSIVVVTPEAN